MTSPLELDAALKQSQERLARSVGGGASALGNVARTLGASLSLYESQLQWGERGEGGGASSSDFDRGLAFVKGGEGEGQVSAGRAGGGGHVGEGEREEGGVQRRVSSIKLLAY